jgi:hypothetical protein
MSLPGLAFITSTNDVENFVSLPKILKTKRQRFVSSVTWQYGYEYTCQKLKNCTSPCIVHFDREAKTEYKSSSKHVFTNKKSLPKGILKRETNITLISDTNTYFHILVIINQYDILAVPSGWAWFSNCRIYS